MPRQGASPSPAKRGVIWPWSQTCEYNLPGHPVPPALPPLASLSVLLDTFPARHLLVLGDLFADEYIYGQTDRVSREAPVLVVRHEASEVKLGGAAYVRHLIGG